MNKRRFIGTAGAVALGLALASSGAHAQQKTIKEQLVGSWTFVSSIDWGKNARGRVVFEPDGHFMFMIFRSDIPKFSGKTSSDGTPEQNKAAISGMIASFGTWSVDEATKTIITNIEASSYPNLNGGTQKRIVSAISATELKYTNPETSAASVSEVVWKRAK
jgi:hypothetical protein